MLCLLWLVSVYADILELLPAEGTVGDRFLVIGSSFGNKRGKIQMGTENCKVISWSDTEIACEVVAADAISRQPSLQMLEFVLNELHLDPLVAAAIERGVRARHQRV